VELSIEKLYPVRIGQEREHDRTPGGDPGLDFGVPLIAHKLLFSEIFQYDMKKRTVRGLPWPNDISKKQGFSSFSTVEAILSKTHILMLTVNAFPLRQQHADINALVPQPASNDLNQKGIAVGLTIGISLAPAPSSARLRSTPL